MSGAGAVAFTLACAIVLTLFVSFYLYLRSVKGDPVAEDPRKIERPMCSYQRGLAINPECCAGKCDNCDGNAVDDDNEIVPCQHVCHVPEGL